MWLKQFHKPPIWIYLGMGTIPPIKMVIFLGMVHLWHCFNHIHGDIAFTLATSRIIVRKLSLLRLLKGSQPVHEI